MGVLRIFYDRIDPRIYRSYLQYALFPAFHVSIGPDSFRRGDSIDVEVVVVCNQPVEKAIIWIRHLPEKRLPGATKVSRKILALKSGRNEVKIKRRAELGGKYRVTASVRDGRLIGILSTAPVAWTAHRVVFHK